jgi:alpha-L-fucosidase
MAPVEVDMPPRDLLRAYMQGWMWHEGEEELVYDAEYLFARYCTSVGRNSNLLVGALPDRRGLIPDRDAGALAQFAALVRTRFGEPLGVASGSGWEVKVALPGRCDVERVVIMEGQSGGQRIRDWVLEGLWPESWGEGWFELARGHAIGHKRIVVLGIIRLAGLRLRVREAAGTPVIRSLSVHGSRVDR